MLSVRIVWIFFLRNLKKFSSPFREKIRFIWKATLTIFLRMHLQYIAVLWCQRILTGWRTSSQLLLLLGTRCSGSLIKEPKFLWNFSLNRNVTKFFHIEFSILSFKNKNIALNVVFVLKNKEANVYLMVTSIIYT